MRLFAFLNALTLLVTLSGCGWLHGLRREVDEGEDADTTRAEAINYDYYRDPANRYAPPPPATVRDTRTAELSGTPVDLSGTRAKNMRMKASEFFAENTRNENSLWSEEGQNNYLFAANKLKMPGDLITIVIEDQLRREMVDTVKKLLPPEYRDQEVRVPGLTKDGADGDKQRAIASTPAAPAAEGEAQAAATTDDPTDHRDIITAEVLERYPNGNVRIRGIKRVPFKRQVRNIEVVAIVRGTDINEKDTVKSSRFFEQQVELYR